MYSRDNNETNLKIYGILDSTDGCGGPELSGLEGMDKQCCAKCHNIRICYYRDNAIITKRKINFEYIEKLKNIKDLETSYAISTCGSNKILSYQFSKTELSTSMFQAILFEQFILLHKMGIIIDDLSEKNFSITKIGVPIIFPGENYKIIKNYGDNSGVEFITVSGKKYFTVTSEKDLYKSGKWASLYNYFKSFLLLTEKNYNYFQFYKEINGRDYFEIPEKNPFETIDYQIDEEPPVAKTKIPGEITDKYIVLDLDNTLIHAKNYNAALEQIENDRSFYVKLISKKTFYKITIRKHLKKFLNELLSYGFKLIVWSAGCEKYVKDIVSVIFKNIPISYTFTAEHVDDESYKKLSLIGNYFENFDLKNCRLVDDNLSHKKGQEDNFLYVDPFYVENDDDFLENFSLVVKNSFN